MEVLLITGVVLFCAWGIFGSPSGGGSDGGGSCGGGCGGCGGGD